MNRNEAVTFAKERILEMMLKDVDKANGGGAKMGAVILSTCVLDCLGVLHAGRRPKKRGEYTEFFETFVSIYMKKYAGQNIYDLRSKLVHFYSANDFFYTDRRTSPHVKNLQTIQNKKCIVVEDFIEDVKKAALQYIADIEKADETDSVYSNFIAMKDMLLGPMRLPSDNGTDTSSKQNRNRPASATTDNVTGTGSNSFRPPRSDKKS